MLELEKFGVIEMTTDEQKEVEGGWLWAVWALVVLYIAIVDYVNP